MGVHIGVSSQRDGQVGGVYGRRGHAKYFLGYAGVYIEVVSGWVYIVISFDTNKIDIIFTSIGQCHSSYGTGDHGNNPYRQTVY